MRRASRTDANHTAILEVFRVAGWWVLDLHRHGGGCADALCVAPGRYRVHIRRPPVLIDVNQVYMIEIKNRAGRNRVGQNQQDFAARCPLPYRVIRTVEEALALVGGR